jgi:hypothetical protein
MNKIWQVTDTLKGARYYMEKMPHVRRYMLENKHHDQIKVVRFEWTYKSELLKIINGAYALGALDQHKLMTGRD